MNLQLTFRKAVCLKSKSQSNFFVYLNLFLCTPFFQFLYKLICAAYIKSHTRTHTQARTHTQHIRMIHWTINSIQFARLCSFIFPVLAQHSSACIHLTAFGCSFGHLAVPDSVSVSVSVSVPAAALRIRLVRRHLVCRWHCLWPELQLPFCY